MQVPVDRAFLSSFLNVFTFTSHGHDALTLPEMYIIPGGSGLSVSAAFAKHVCLVSVRQTVTEEAAIK